MTGTASITISAGTGAVFGFFTNYFVERFKRRGAMNDASREAYASWFTAEAPVLRRIDAVCERLVGFPTDREKHEALMLEIRSLVDDGQTLITAMNEAILTEKIRRVWRIVSTMNKFLVGVVGTLKFSGRQYKKIWRFMNNSTR